ncbi:MAG: M16 family metallopeptidase [Anaerolineae bacterium]
MYCKTTLDNGLRILTTSMPHTRSVSVGIFTGVGSRYEREEERGISHFIEHMLFKGTERRPTAQHIAEAIEGIGGVMNGGTNNELTVYWAKVAHHHLPVALDVLLDIFQHSKFDPEEVEKERQVILQEISRMMDMPEAWVHVLIAGLIWPNHPVGWDTAGTKESVLGITRQDMLSYLARMYTTRNTVISLAGNLEHDYVVEWLTTHLAQWNEKMPPSFLPVTDEPAGPALKVESRKTEQAHLCVGLRGLSLHDPDRFKLRVINAILGEGMSSRLFLEIREKRGLAYSVGSYTSYLRDTGAIVLYAGTPPQKAAEAVSAMMEQLDLLRMKEVPEAELNKAKEFTKGRILLRMEDTFANAEWIGHQEALDQKVLTVDQVIAQIDAVTPTDVQQIAQRLFTTEKLNLAIVGPFKKEENFRRRLKL